LDLKFFIIYHTFLLQTIGFGEYVQKVNFCLAAVLVCRLDGLKFCHGDDIL